MLGRHESDGFEDLGSIKWDLVLALIVAWILVFFCMIKGIKSAGRVVYVTATFPYLVLVILLIRGVTLPGAMLGLRFYIVPDLTRLWDVNVKISKRKTNLVESGKMSHT